MKILCSLLLLISTHAMASETKTYFKSCFCAFDENHAYVNIFLGGLLVESGKGEIVSLGRSSLKKPVSLEEKFLFCEKLIKQLSRDNVCPDNIDKLN